MVWNEKMCRPSNADLERGDSRDLGRGNDRGPKAPEKETGGALQGTVEQELHYELVESRVKSKVRQPPGGRNRRMDRKGGNHSNGRGRGPRMDRPVGPWCLCPRLLSTTSGASLHLETKPEYPSQLPQTQQNSEEQEPQEWAQGAGT